VWAGSKGFRIDMWFPDRVEVEIVPPLFGEHEDMFMDTCESVFHATRHGVWFMPNYI
ncbi:unnamed protein product, partial [marine sediment metagenome]